LSSISAEQYPTWDALGHSAQERLARSSDAKAAKTRDSRLVHFFKFLNLYKATNVFLTSDIRVTDPIITNYMTFLLSGHSIKNIEIKSDTIKGYMRVVNDYYVEHTCLPPFDAKSKSEAARLLSEQEKFEQDPARREPLTDAVMEKMRALASVDSLGFRAAVWDITGLGRFGGFRQQEFAMDVRDTIKYYVLPNGVKVTRAFCVKNIHFRDKMKARMRLPLIHEDECEEVGPEYEVQKNRRNGQIIWFRRERRYPEYCPVILSLRLVWRAETLGQKGDDPLCVYRDKDGICQYLTGRDVTEYFRFVVKLTMPNISAEELKLISTHSIRVTACVLLAEAGKDGWYIKLRLRWMSDCYEIYIRNTSRIALMHNDAMNEANRRLSEMAVTLVNLPAVLVESGVLDRVSYEIEDDD